MPKKKKSNKKGYRRYPVDKHPAYDSAYDRALRESSILNPEKRHGSNAYRLEHPETGLIELEGDSNNKGFYKKSGGWQLGAIPYFKQELAELEERFKAWAQLQVETGKALELPTEWPTELLELRLKKEALLDIRLRERAKLKKLITEKEEAEEKARRGPMLPNGPQGNEGNYYNHKTGVKRRMIDGQFISKNEKGQPYIGHPGSPYNGMLLHDYLLMSKEWTASLNLDVNTLRKEIEADYQRRRKEAFKNGVEPPSKRGITPQRLRKQRLAEIKKADWPDVPKGSRIDELKKQEVSK